MIKVLVIEDDPPILDNILDTLEAEGFEVQGATDGLAGLELAQTLSPDLILCDIVMPRLDGYGVLQNLRGDPSTANTPFIFLTCRSERADMRQGMEMGADDYLPKPYTRAELLGAINTRLKKLEAFRNLQREYEQIKTSDQLKSDMIRVAAHDLNNPLSVMSLTLQMLVRVYGKELPQDVLNKLASIEAQSNKLKHIASDILSVERIDAMNVERLVELVDLTELVRDEFHNYDENAQRKKQRFLLEQSTQPIMVHADVLELDHAISNLISNAIKYTQVGGTVRVVVRKEAARAVFAVEDNGYGIPQENQGRLFEAFYRVKTQETSDIEGTGLGLHLVKKIVERNQGTMIFSSVYGKGSSFGFWMPLGVSISNR